MSNIQQANIFKAQGNQAFKNKDYESAIKFFTQAIQCNPNDHVFYSNRSGAYLNAGDYEKALEDAETCVKMNSKWARGYQRKGTALFYMDKIDDAISTYKEGLSYEPDNDQLKKDLKAAEDRKKQEENPSANPMMNQAYLQAMMKLISNPETKDFIQDPGFMQKVQTIMQNPAAMSYFANDPKIKKAFEVISSSAPSEFDFQNLMKGYQNQKEAPKKKESEKSEKNESRMDEEPIISEQEAPKKKTESKPAPPPKQEQQIEEDPADILRMKGNAEYKQKNFPAAIDYYEQAIQLNPNEPLFYNNKAAAYIEMGEFEKAHQQLDKADQLFENGYKDYVKKAKVLARRGNIYFKQEKYEEAIAAYEKSLLEDGAGKVRDELRLAKKLLKEKKDKEYINPELAEKACELGNTYFKEGKFPDAVKQYEEAIKRDPTVAKYSSNLGTVYIKLMEWQRAKENFEIALKKDPNYIKAYGKKGDCHFAMKEYHKALETYEAGLKIDPNNEICKMGIQKTQQAIYMSSGSQQDQQQRAQRAMADPEIQAILQTPEVRNALQDLQTNPAAIQQIMKDPDLAQKIQKLIQAGVIGTR